MRKKCYHFFGGLLNAQANWLNKMSEKGYRLIRAGKMLYEFEECKPNEVKYCVEFIGEKSKENAKDYSLFLEDMGYKVFFKLSIVFFRFGLFGAVPARTVARKYSKYKAFLYVGL